MRSVQNIKTVGLAVHVHHDWEPFFRAFDVSDDDDAFERVDGELRVRLR